MEKTTFERAIEEGYYISSNAPADGDFYRAEDVDKLKASHDEMARLFDKLQRDYYGSQQKVIRLEEIERLYNEALKQEPVGWVIWHAGTSVYSFGAEKPKFNLPGSTVLPRYAAPVPRTADQSLACNCPGGNKPASSHAPNCPVRLAATEQSSVVALPEGYQAIFNAIAAATRIEGGHIAISVKDFQGALAAAPKQEGK